MQIRAIPFISFSWLMALSEHPSHILNFRGNSFRFPTCWNDFIIPLGISWSFIVFTMLRYDQCIPPVIYYFIITMLIFSKVFLYLRWLCDFLFLIIFKCCIHSSLCICWTKLVSMEWSQLVQLYNLLNVLFNSVCNYFIEDFCMYVHWGIWSMVFFVCVYLCSYLLWVSATDFVKWIWEDSFFFCFIE
jgi:hypothetical protein